MIQSIASAIFIFSLFGLLFIVFRKKVLLTELPETGPSNLKETLSGFPKFVTKLPIIKNISLDIFLQKSLSRTRIFILKTDNKTADMLQKMRENSRKKKFLDDNYWDEIRRATKRR